MHGYLNLAEPTKIRLNAEISTPFLRGAFRYVKGVTMTWRIIHIADSEKMRLKLDNLLVKKQGEEFTIPLSDISVIVAEGGDTVVTLRLLSALSKYNIALVVCDNEHLPTGIYSAVNGHFHAHKKFQAQLGWTKEQKDLLWKGIIQYKINNQQDVLAMLEKNLEAIQLLADYIEHIEPGDVTNREGHAAKVYFNELFGKSFVRISQREADVVNAGLNYGYTIFRAQMARIVAGYGLNPLLGIFHKNEFNQFNLVDDLMEPFRPIVDLWVYHQLRESAYLRYEDRLNLVNLLNAKIKYGKESCTVTTAMDKYVKGFINYMEKGDSSRFCCPIVSSLEWED